MKQNNRLFYLTTINLCSLRAQSIQVKNFVRSLSKFSNYNNKKFVAYSYSIIPNNYGNYFKSFSRCFSRRRIIIQTYICLQLFLNKVISKNDVFYSRDLFPLFLLSIMGFRSVHEYHHPSAPINSLVLKFYNLLPNTKLVVISNALKSYVVRNHYCRKNNCLTLPSCYDSSEIINLPSKDVCRHQLNMSKDKIYIVHTGNPYLERGVENFKYICQISKKIVFIHIGGDSEQIKRLKSYAKNKNIDNCKFIPHSEVQLIRKYQYAADFLFYIITEKTSTFWCCSPLKIPEYMASNTPIIASTIGSITEFLDAKTCFPFFEISKDSIQSAVIEALANPISARNRAANARKKVLKNYTMEKRAELLFNFIN